MTGAGGITFLVAGTASALAVVVLTAVSRPRLAASIVIAVSLVLGSVLAFGAVRLSATPTGSLRVAVVAAPAPGYQPDIGTPDGRRLVAADLAWLRSPALRQAEIVVFPETDVEVRAGDMSRLETAFGRVARERDVTVVLGVARMLEDGRHNTALVFPADGSAPIVYDKQHPIVGQEAGTVSGDRDVLLGTYDDRVGVAVCADLSHPGLARSYANQGARLLAVPTLDFGIDAWSQSRVQILRGLESGFATARASRDGNLTIADAQGRILAETRPQGTHTVSLIADVPLGRGATVNARLGDWLSWLPAHRADPAHAMPEVAHSSRADEQVPRRPGFPARRRRRRRPDAMAHAEHLRGQMSHGASSRDVVGPYPLRAHRGIAPI